jgi:hypothetical protein
MIATAGLRVRYSQESGVSPGAQIEGSAQTGSRRK